MYYDTLYKNNQDVFGNKPSTILIKTAKELSGPGEALDLGCGQGRDVFYLARKGFQVTAVDNSQVAIDQVKGKAERNRLKNISAVCMHVAKYEIKPDTFRLIVMVGLLHFLKKSEAVALIENAKKNILSGGYIIITAFTVNNPPSDRRKCHFELGEMRALFDDPAFEITFYREGTRHDEGHPGQEEPHEHGMVEVVARRKS